MTLLKLSFIPLMAGLFVLTLLQQFAFGHGMSEAEKQAIIEGGNLIYLWIGATHMLGGYDHLMFVFGIIFFLTSFRDIVKYVTAFTLGHSITLIFATYNGIQLNYFLIDAVIALSVCYIAFANLDGFRKYLSVKPPNMMLMIIGLGLIHGFGLSTRLQALPLSEDSLLLNIISFNAGIELGQITALAGMLVLVAFWKKSQSFATHSRIANFMLIAAGLMLCLMQLHDFTQSSEPEKLIASTTGAPGILATEAVADTINSKKTQTSQRKDSITITIPARGSKEYKLLFDKGAMIEYSWKSDSEELFFDFHGEPAGDTSGYFESFKKGTEKVSSGSLTAPFRGSIGWYWKNNSSKPVDIVLKTKGNYKKIDS
ncbi:MAG: HupE/UreJ family protein [Nitrospira sp.]|nr:HupE/UreJ family protein [bacterium]MBL7048223.1 HupE/UreJ family protein [Nitrospira sp.]